MIRSLFVCLILANCIVSAAFSQTPSRIKWSINDNWKYLAQGADFAQRPQADDSKWQTVNLPHTWNASDPFDDDETSRRGVSWYRKKIMLDQHFRNKKLYLNFEGAYQTADVYVNGVFAGQHKGGYTAFTVDITDLVKLGDVPAENLIAVQVNNAHNDFIPPLSIGYAAYGGIYRDAWLIATEKVHFNMLDHASGSVYISTPAVSAEKATVRIKSTISNEDVDAKKVELVHIIYDAHQKEVTRLYKNLSVAPHQEATVELQSPEIKNPALWSPDSPYLYQVKSQIIENGAVRDETINPLGFRWFSFDADKGFSLNGKKLLLKGTNRHQDFKGRGDALTNDDHYRDLKIIKDMGCNFLRLAHYPQAPEVLHLADKMGLLIWEEIPLVNYMNPVPEFLENSKNMIREMIRQHYNHPSIIIWGSMNEVLLWSEKAERIQVQDNVAYVNKVREYAVKLDSTVRAEDPARYSAMAMHMSEDYDKFHLSGIPRLSGYNIYNGWYSGKVEEFKSEIDKIHTRNPKHLLFISEYGAEADKRVNTENPQRFDFTGQYQRVYHESYLGQIQQMPYLGGTAIWNQFDFSQPNVGGVSNNMNQKGMLTWDRKPKDVYYLYKANWNPDPMVHILSCDWQERAGIAGALSTIEVYSNLDEVTLTVNGKSYGSKKPDKIKKCTWHIPLQAGKNVLYASGNGAKKTIADYSVINYRTYKEDLKTAPFRQISINTGSNTQYLDSSGNIWIEDRPYKAGSFGYIGGTPATLSIKMVKKNTEDTPLFYSYLDDIKDYRFDVPDGAYELELCFIENDSQIQNDRQFDVAVNGNKLIEDLNLNATYGFATAVRKKYIVHASDEKGILVSFDAKKGKAVLSGIRLKAL